MLLSDIDFPTDLYYKDNGQFLDCFQNLLNFAPGVYGQYIPNFSSTKTSSTSHQSTQHLKNHGNQLNTTLGNPDITTHHAPVKVQQNQFVSETSCFASQNHVQPISTTSVYSETVSLSSYTVPARTPTLFHSMVQLASNLAEVWVQNSQTSATRRSSKKSKQRAVSPTVCPLQPNTVVISNPQPSIVISNPQPPTVIIPSDPTVVQNNKQQANKPLKTRQSTKFRKNDSTQSTDDSESDCNQESKVEQKKVKETKQADKSGFGELPMAVIAGVSFSLLTLFSAYKTSEHMSRYEFLQQFYACLLECEQRLDQVKLWIRERQMLKLSIPRVVVRDVAQLTDLVESMNRLDTKDKDRQVGPVYLGVSISSFLVVSSVLFGGQHAGSVTKIGISGLILSATYGAFLYGRHGTSVHQESFQQIACRAHRAVTEIGQLQTHADLVLSTLEYELHE